MASLANPEVPGNKVEIKSGLPQGITWRSLLRRDRQPEVDMEPHRVLSVTAVKDESE
jgi:hypothetical protein